MYENRIFDNVEVTWNDPEFMYDNEYLSEPIFRFVSRESDGGIEDWGNAILES